MTGGALSGDADMDFSVIVPFYNSAAHIESCATALLSQCYPADRYEIIFVDNGSADVSRDIVQRYPRIRVLSESKQGPYAARNRGAAASSGEIIAFTDADCVPATDWLQTMAKVMKDPSVQIILGGVTMPDSGVLALLSAYEDERGEYIFSRTTQELYYGYTNNMAVRRAALETVGPFCEVARGGDVILIQSAIEAYNVKAVRYAPQALVLHLEITGPWVWIRKRFIYGRASRKYRPIVRRFRSMTAIEGLEVFRRTVGRHGYSRSKSTLLLILLALGLCAYRLGRWTARGSRTEETASLCRPAPE
jgi:glycosyltransferase involved in cell wall biosynthesis